MAVEQKKFLDASGITKLKALIKADFVDKGTTIAGVDLNDNITKAELLTALNVADGAQVNVIETVKVNGTALTPTSKAVNIEIPAAAEYSVIKDASSADYAAVYHLTKDGVNVGQAINIPKDMVVSKAGYVEYNGTDAKVTVDGQEVTVKTPKPAAGKYVVMLIANSTSSQVWLNVASLISVTDDVTIRYNTSGKLEVIMNATGGVASYSALQNEITRATDVEGQLKDLNTGETNNLVGAINEVNLIAHASQTTIESGTESGDTKTGIKVTSTSDAQGAKTYTLNVLSMSATDIENAWEAS